ncbi:hypothetical protein COW36_21750 [bacterium (Candidatus Blackallbacteria) CG17_big_fil_post_rev_8_21_14_2_50_48_46]|uniref:DUF4154 domain-containing protein n=1 Tax=bacterium (Candidatus Blackallbacteria) CG17_big_fil_post_rev_8_21_14_2_50_48_46 TaxID=2014261 RepID=A0A2M7FYW3_9BACT|nr:MAG: hypothetical protein COW64_11110 [bacterium (Candidatus Blackallbacteria) CG18_big_fil_WC_8_21_14_2_50_49_26]PIW14394.1 MAG: hypothetical protein COW36_21750 [bacterium (Candidatus Blackallbacteria) CG17_big_fil_post_rev_8_21_14_2_50_48_46]PIW46901.1 MAG: hypothetical protein COW20_14165 [bacterium (Candidatus Blackallbacteria) CG13_big_fil_rev_8_21_14_2_50_49_14]
MKAKIKTYFSICLVFMLVMGFSGVADAASYKVISDKTGVVFFAKLIRFVSTLQGKPIKVGIVYDSVNSSSVSSMKQVKAGLGAYGYETFPVPQNAVGNAPSYGINVFYFAKGSNAAEAAWVANASHIFTFTTNVREIQSKSASLCVINYKGKNRIVASQTALSQQGHSLSSGILRYVSMLP